MSHLWEFSKDLSSRTGVCHDCNDIIGAGVTRKILYTAFIAKTAFCIILWNVKILCRRKLCKIIFNGTFKKQSLFYLWGSATHTCFISKYVLPSVRASSQLFLNQSGFKLCFDSTIHGCNVHWLSPTFSCLPPTIQAFSKTSPFPGFVTLGFVLWYI